MDLDRFWQLIEESRHEAEECREQARVLADLLAALSPEEILAFQIRLDERMRESYRWDLWAVAFIINAGCSDDGFDYFRGWLIARGRKFFEAAMQVPEWVGDGVAPGAEQDYDRECESILYAAHYAYERRAGQEIPLAARTTPVLTEPQGEPWEEEDLERLYPALFRRFFPE